MNPTRSKLLRLLFLTQVLAVPARAADLIEPWERGFSDLELFARVARGGEATGAATLGFGLGRGLSAGLTTAGGDEPSEVGLMLVWSHELGRLGALDLVGYAHTETREAELDRLEHAVGVEWSAAGGPLQPYFRATLLREAGATRFHPLVGVRLPVARVDLHVELSSEEPAEGGSWPLHVAVGPNWALGEGMELLPELSLLWNRAENRLEPALTVGWIVNPARVFQRLPRATAAP